MTDRRESLAAARLYLVCGAQSDELLSAALSGGVDLVQLRMKRSSDSQILAAARRFAAICAEHGVLLVLNDRPDLVPAAGADGVHLGQEDVASATARELVGPERLVGLSTHTPSQINSAGEDVDYLGVGPVFTTPTKPGRAAVGVELVRFAAHHARTPYFAIGGINAENASMVRAAGATRLAVVRAITEAEDPRRAAHELRASVDPQKTRSEASIGAT